MYPLTRGSKGTDVPLASHLGNNVRIIMEKSSFDQLEFWDCIDIMNVRIGGIDTKK